MRNGLVLLLALLVLGAPAWSQGGYAQQREQGERCMARGDLRCAEAAFADLVRQRPTDPSGHALRGIALVRLERYSDAIVALERAMELGKGTWDILANYATALRHTGRVREAIDWSYRTLEVVPRLVDVRGDLAAMLVADGRHHEALSLLVFFDRSLEVRGHKPYFAAQRMAIERSLLRRSPSSTGPRPSLRMVRMEGFFHAPVSLADGRFDAFIVDTGASTMTLPRAMLKDSRAAHSVTRPGVRSRLADGRTVQGDVVVLTSLLVGPFELRAVEAFVCDSCVQLLGQEALSRFDLRSAREADLEVMTLTPR